MLSKGIQNATLTLYVSNWYEETFLNILSVKDAEINLLDLVTPTDALYEIWLTIDS